MFYLTISVFMKVAEREVVGLVVPTSSEPRINKVVCSIVLHSWCVPELVRPIKDLKNEEWFH